MLVSLQFLIFITYTLKTECGDQSGRGFKHIYMYTHVSPLQGGSDEICIFLYIFFDNFFHLDVHYVCMLVSALSHRVGILQISTIII